MNSRLNESISTVAASLARTRSSLAGVSWTSLYSYWKPEQPPPATTMRSTVPAGCLLSTRPIFLAARSVRMTGFDARAASVMIIPCDADALAWSQSNIVDCRWKGLNERAGAIRRRSDGLARAAVSGLRQPDAVGIPARPRPDHP